MSPAPSSSRDSFPRAGTCTHARDRADGSLEKPWNERPAAAKRYETDIPADGPEINGVKSLPPALLDLVRNSSPQQNLVNYDEVHTWWWVAYEAMLADLKAQGESSGWKEIEASVKR